MRALLLTRYGPRGATSRLRALQFIPSLEARGWEVKVSALFPDSYLERLYRTGGRSVPEVAGCYLQRTRLLASVRESPYDAIYLQTELLPGLPFSVERRFYRRNPRVVVDYDDAAFEPYANRPLLREKIPDVIRAAREVIVGNRYLSSYARQFNPNVTLIPTVVDGEHYQPRQSYGLNGAAVIGWVGTPVTARYLDLLGPALRAVALQRDIVLRAVGGPEHYSMPGVPVDRVAWSADTEADVIRGFDIGVMPLEDEPFAHGKSGLKLIQYMAAGVPSVASAIGANRDILADGVNGLLANSPSDFAELLIRLIDDGALRERLGRSGRAAVEREYSLQAQADRFADVLERVAVRGEE